MFVFVNVFVNVFILYTCLYLLSVPQVKPQAGVQHHQVSEAHQVTPDFRFVNVFVLYLCLYSNVIFEFVFCYLHF